MLDMGFHEELEILDATPHDTANPVVLGNHATTDGGARQALPEGRAAHRNLGDNRGHQDIAYQAVAVPPTDVEHAVVNLLRFRRRNGGPVLRYAGGRPPAPPCRKPANRALMRWHFRASTAQEQRNPRVPRRCGTSGRGSAWLPMSRRTGIDLPSRFRW